MSRLIHRSCTHRSRTRREGGFVYIFMLLGLTMMVGFGALMVDGSRLMQTRSQLQATADGAALAAVSQLPFTPLVTGNALDFAAKNMPADEHGEVLKSSDVEIGNWNPGSRTFTPGAFPGDAVRVTVKRAADNDNAVPLTLARALGFEASDVTASAVASFGTAQTWDIVLVQDVTGSFRSELSQAVAADRVLLECIASHAGDESRFGVVTFTGWSQVKTDPLKIKDAYLTLDNHIASIKSCGSWGSPPCSGTNIGVGLKSAVNMLVGNPPEDPDTRQAIVLVSDGEPNASSNGSMPSSTDADLKKFAKRWARKADKAGISVFVVFYDEDNSKSSKKFLKTLVKGDGIFLSTPDPADLPGLLMNICAQLPQKLVQ